MPIKWSTWTIWWNRNSKDHNNNQQTQIEQQLNNDSYKKHQRWKKEYKIRW